MNNLEVNILEAINNLIDEFQKNPYKFLYESDLQCALFANLRTTISEKIKIPDKQYELELIYSEYGSKIDIVVLDKKETEKLNINDFNQHYNQLPIFLGIEMKYVIMGYRKGFNILGDDYKKLKELHPIVNNKLAICFLQNEETFNSIMEDIEKKKNKIDKMNEILDINGMYVVGPNQLLKITE